MTIDITNFEDVRQLIHAKLMSSDFRDITNFVKEHIAADIWKTFYIALPTPEGYAVCNITYSLLEQWHNISIDTLHSVADENDAGTQTCMKLSEALQAYLDTPPWEDSPQMYVISNKNAFCGASAVLTEQIQQKISLIFPDGCYILFSSIHEVIAISAVNTDANDLAKMVYEINSTQVDERDRLSNHVFKLENGVLAVVA